MCWGGGEKKNGGIWFWEREEGVKNEEVWRDGR
jgi:hypothetical protein